MTGLQDLSDDELRNLYSQGQGVQAPSIQALSDDELKALYAKQQPADQSAAPPSWWDVLTGSKAARDYSTQHDPQLALRAKIAGTTPQDLRSQSESAGGEFLKGIPVAGAVAPQTEGMTAFEAEHPWKAALARATGGIVGLAPAVAAAPEIFGAGAAQGLGTRLAAGAGSQASLQFADSKARGKNDEEALNDAKTAAMLSGVGTGGAAIVGSAIAPTLQAGARTLVNADTRLTPGQLLGGLVQKFENVAEHTPFVGTSVEAARVRSLSSFNRSIENETLAPIGKTVSDHIEPGYAGRENVHSQINAAYRDAYAGAGMSMTPQLAQDIGAVVQNAQTNRLLPQPQMDQLNAVVRNKIAGKFGNAPGPINGDQINNVDSELRLLADRYRQDTSADNRELGQAIGDVRTAFNQHFAAQNPQAVQPLANADAAYSRYVRLRQAGASTAVNGIEGLMTPTQLQMAVKTADQSFAKRAMSEGRAPFQQLAQAGKMVLPNRMPNSGTPERIESLVALETMLNNPAAFLGSVVAPSAVGRALYSTPAQDLIRNAIVAGPQRQAMGAAMKRYGPQAPDAIARALMQPNQGQR